MKHRGEDKTSARCASSTQREGSKHCTALRSTDRPGSNYEFLVTVVAAGVNWVDTHSRSGAGASGVGHFAIQFASHFGAHVITTGSTRDLRWLRDLGANEVIDHTISGFEDVVTHVDVVIDLVGNLVGSTATRPLGELTPGGLIVSVPVGGRPTMVEDAAAAGMRATGYAVSADGSTLSVISRLLESGDVRVFVDQVFELDQAAAARAALGTGHTRGKIVLTVSPG